MELYAIWAKKHESEFQKTMNDIFNPFHDFSIAMFRFFLKTSINILTSSNIFYNVRTNGLIEMFGFEIHLGLIKPSLPQIFLIKLLIKPTPKIFGMSGYVLICFKRSDSFVNYFLKD